MRYQLCFVSLINFFNHSAVAKIRVGAQLEGQKHVAQFIDGRAIAQITGYSGKLAYRDVVDQVLSLQALHFGGYKGEIEFVQADNYQRRLRLLEQALLDLSVSALWLRNAVALKGHLYISSPLLNSGKAKASFYVHHCNNNALSVTHLHDLKILNAISNSQWKINWKIM